VSEQALYHGPKCSIRPIVARVSHGRRVSSTHRMAELEHRIHTQRIA
jgi:hypothetical protein